MRIGNKVSVAGDFEMPDTYRLVRVNTSFKRVKSKPKDAQEGNFTISPLWC